MYLTKENNITNQTAKYSVFAWYLKCTRECCNDWLLLGRFYDIQGPFGYIDVKRNFENIIREEIDGNFS